MSENSDLPEGQDDFIYPCSHPVRDCLFKDRMDKIEKELSAAIDLIKSFGSMQPGGFLDWEKIIEASKRYNEAIK